MPQIQTHTSPLDEAVAYMAGLSVDGVVDFAPDVDTNGKEYTFRRGFNDHCSVPWHVAQHGAAAVIRHLKVIDKLNLAIRIEQLEAGLKSLREQLASM